MRERSSKGLTPKQQLFAVEFLRDLNATRAAMRAGYSVRTARKAGSRLLAVPAIKVAIEHATVRILQRAEIDAERVVREAAAVAFADTAKFFDTAGNLLPIDKLPENLRRALTAFETEEIPGADPGERVSTVTRVQLADRTAALKFLSKYLRADQLAAATVRALVDAKDEAR